VEGKAAEEAGIDLELSGRATDVCRTLGQQGGLGQQGAWDRGREGVDRLEGDPDLVGTGGWQTCQGEQAFQSTGEDLASEEKE
jgi:hypothetical protein